MNETVGGKYELLKILGRGGMSTVYLAMDHRLKKHWAIKKITVEHMKNITNTENMSELLREAELLKELEHPSLPRIVDVLMEKQKIYIVMDYIAGRSLHEILREKGVIEQTIVIDWGKKLCQVLSYLHSRVPAIIYRDMKPSNIILTPEGEIKLIDFGIAREWKEEKREDTICLGTRGYAAPEQFGGSGQTDERTDIYSLGVTLYHLVTGKSPLEPPYEICPIREWKAGLSEGLEEILCKCHHPNPQMRYQSVNHIYKELCNYKQKEKKYRKRLMLPIGIFLFFIICSFVGSGSAIIVGIIKENKLSKQYERFLQGIGEKTEREKSYWKAIQINPEDVRAYEKLVKLYNEEGWDAAQEKKIMESILTHEEVLQKDKQYANLCFRIGTLYWNQKNAPKHNIKNSFPWYEKAEKFRGESYIFNPNVTKAYVSIGRFYEEINKVISYDSYSNKDFQMFWKEIVEVDRIFKSNKNEWMDTRKMFYQLVKEAVSEFYFKFSAIGIKKEEMVSVLRGGIDEKDDIFRRLQKLSKG